MQPFNDESKNGTSSCSAVNSPPNDSSKPKTLNLNPSCPPLKEVMDTILVHGWTATKGCVIILTSAQNVVPTSLIHPNLQLSGPPGGTTTATNPYLKKTYNLPYL